MEHDGALRENCGNPAHVELGCMQHVHVLVLMI